MGYIKFVLSTRRVDADGNPTDATISRISSDMADSGLLETNIIMHALACKGGKKIEDKDFILDKGILDVNVLC